MHVDSDNENLADRLNVDDQQYQDQLQEEDNLLEIVNQKHDAMIGALKPKILQKIKQKRFLRKSSALSVGESVDEDDGNSLDGILNQNPDDPINFNP